MSKVTLKDMLLGKIAEIDEGGFPYKIHLHCAMTDFLECPDLIREKFPKQVMFTLDNTLNHYAKYNWDTQIFSFGASFGGNRTQISIPAGNIHVIVNDWDNSVVQFGAIQESPGVQAPVPTEQEVPKNKTEHIKQQVKSLYTKKHLSLVVDNTRSKGTK